MTVKLIVVCFMCVSVSVWGLLFFVLLLFCSAGGYIFVGLSLVTPNSKRGQLLHVQPNNGNNVCYDGGCL